MHFHHKTEAQDTANLTIGIGILLNVVFVVVEVIFGFLSDSLALLADAGHNAGDVLGLLLAFGANILLQRKPDQEHTYGWRRSTIMAALLNAIILLVAVGGIVREAVSRIGAASAITSTTVIWVAGIGTVINLFTALLFRNKKEQDLNLRGAFLHMAADAGVSAGVVVSALVIRSTGFYWLDPVVSLVIAGVILWSTWGLLRDAFHLSMGGVPRGIDFSEVLAAITSFSAVQDVHDLHIWSLSTQDVALTAHVVKSGAADNDELINRIVTTLQDQFKINHVTLQFERQRLNTCRDDL